MRGRQARRAGKQGRLPEDRRGADQPSKRTPVEPKKENEFTVPELEGKFRTEMEHVGFGVFKDPDGNTWDYRLGEKGERLYSKIK